MNQQRGKSIHDIMRTGPTSIRSEAVTNGAHEQLISPYLKCVLLDAKYQSGDETNRGCWSMWCILKEYEPRTKKSRPVVVKLCLFEELILASTSYSHFLLGCLHIAVVVCCPSSPSCLVTAVAAYACCFACFLPSKYCRFTLGIGYSTASLRFITLPVLLSFAP